MKWDNAPVYRRRRRAVGAAAVLLLVGVPWAVVSALDEAPDAQPASVASPGQRQWSGRAPAITLAFAGDTQAHGASARITSEGLGAMGERLAAADVAMLNLETVVVRDRTGLVPQPKTYTFATGPAILDSLKASGVDLVTAANNHSMDYGATGMDRMLQVKASSPVPMVGIGKDADEAWAPWTTEVRGRRVVVFGATDVLDDHLDWKAGPGKPGLAKVKDEDGFNRLLEAVRAARAKDPDDVVVVYLHSGVELTRCPTARQKYTDEALARAGADVVIGSHAHVLQPTATIGTTAVAYGLGNFAFPASRSDTTATGVLTVTVPPSGAPTMAFDPARIQRGLPVQLDGLDRRSALDAWGQLGKGCS